MKEKAVEEMIFKSRSTSPLMRAVRETFDKFDMGRQAELRIFCGEEKNLEEKFKEENTKGEKINEEAFLPVARSLLLTSSPLLRFSFLTLIISSPMTVFTTLLDLKFSTISTRSLLSSYPASNTISLPDASPIKVEAITVTTHSNKNTSFHASPLLLLLPGVRGVEAAWLQVGGGAHRQPAHRHSQKVLTDDCDATLS